MWRVCGLWLGGLIACLLVCRACCECCFWLPGFYGFVRGFGIFVFLGCGGLVGLVGLCGLGVSC